MQNSRLAALFLTLDRKERRSLRKFIATPFFNQRQDVIDLCELLTAAVEANAPIPDKRTAFQHLYGKALGFDDHKVRMAMSFLLKSVERFLVHEAFFQDEIQAGIKLAEIYRERNLPKHFERTMRATRAVQEKSTFRNAAFFANAHRIEFEQYRFFSGQRRTSDLHLQAITDHLDLAYFSEKLRQACRMVSHQAVYRIAYDFGLAPEILRRTEAAGLLSVPAVSVYYFCYRSLTEPEEPAHFQKLKKLLVTEAARFPVHEVSDLYLIAINFCIKRYNEGDRAFLTDQFELYKSGLEQGIFLNNGRLSRFTYRNVVSIGLLLGEFGWVENFIHGFRENLEPKHRQSIFSFNLARLEHQRKNYGPALQLLQQGEYRDLLLNLAAKSLILKIYFETDEFDALDSHLDAMQKFIRRKDLIGYHREGYLALLYFTRKILETTGKAERQVLRSEIEAAKGVAEQEWLFSVLSPQSAVHSPHS